MTQLSVVAFAENPATSALHDASLSCAKSIFKMRVFSVVMFNNIGNQDKLFRG